jgi:tripartite-type tricarboxylate transporter receptor subunit TctC
MTNRSERIHLTSQHRRAIVRWASALAVTLVAGLALAQVAPAGPPIKLIVPFTPGTGIDLIARQIGPKLAERLGRPVVVENRSGASGNLGTEAVVRAAADGSTLLVTVNTLVMNRALYPNLSFDAVRDLDPVTITSWGQLLLVAHPKTGIANANDLIARAKAKPGALNYGSPGNGTPHHLAMELVKNQAQVFITHIPYRGTGPAVTDLLGAQIDLMFLPIHVALQHVKAEGHAEAAGGAPQRRAEEHPRAARGEDRVRDAGHDAGAQQPAGVRFADRTRRATLGAGDQGAAHHGGLMQLHGSLRSRPPGLRRSPCAAPGDQPASDGPGAG